VAAPLGATGLAAAVIKNPEHLSRLSWGNFLFILIIFSVVAAVLLILCFMEFLDHDTPRDEEGEESDGKHRTEKKVVESPLNIVFSLAVLLWAVIIACYHAEPAIGPVQPAAAPRLTPRASVLESPLSGFPRREDDPTKIPKSRADLLTWKTNMSNALAKPGDLLLLLGSADCTSIQKSKDMTNKDLARNRAENVRRMLIKTGPLTDKEIQAESLYQHQNCRESEDMRAVFPVLIHMEEKPK
jgi:heme/copper-type cytochrome/quinol oxidase subunit 2